MIMLISAVLATASSAITPKIFVFTASGPICTTSSSGPSEPASFSVGTSIEARNPTAR